LKQQGQLPGLAFTANADDVRLPRLQVLPKVAEVGAGGRSERLDLSLRIDGDDVLLPIEEDLHREPTLLRLAHLAFMSTNCTRLIS